MANLFLSFFFCFYFIAIYVSLFCFILFSNILLFVSLPFANSRQVSSFSYFRVSTSLQSTCVSTCLQSTSLPVPSSCFLIFVYCFTVSFYSLRIPSCSFVNLSFFICSPCFVVFLLFTAIPFLFLR